MFLLAVHMFNLKYYYYCINNVLQGHIPTQATVVKSLQSLGVGSFLSSSQDSTRFVKNPFITLVIVSV